MRLRQLCRAGVFACGFSCVLAWAQAPAAEITTQATAPVAEIVNKEAAPTFKSGTNLVPVPVVVRDRNGKAIGNLGIEDFELFDNGKPQMISKFSVEKLLRKDMIPTSTPAPPGTSADTPKRTWVRMVFRAGSSPTYLSMTSI